jgi:hypothetical protein
MLKVLLPVLFLLLSSVGCSSSILPGQVSPDQALPGTVLYTDDFSNTHTGWGIWNRDGAVVDYHNGGLRIQVDENQYDFWSVAGMNFRDAQIEVDATRIGGPTDNDFGILCRYRNKDNFYMLVVSSDGYYGIARMENGQYSMIGAQQLQYSSALASAGAAVQGQGPLHLRADCVGSTLRLYANGQKLMEAQDGDFPSGDVGVLAGAYNGKGVDILFDNFVVKKP